MLADAVAIIGTMVSSSPKYLYYPLMDVVYRIWYLGMF